MSQPRSPTSSPHQIHSPSNINTPSLPPLNTSNPNKRTPSQRPQSYAQNRISSFSNASKMSENRSRPVSNVFPAFHSSLSYTLVRDFAYPIVHPWHYGPPLEPSEVNSGNSTPASERQRRLSDPANATWDGTSSQWSAGPWGGDGFFSNQQLPPMAYGDGPPYSEDEDLQSPVVVSSRHKKHKSTFAATGSRPFGRGRSSGHNADEQGQNGLSPRQEKMQKYSGSANGEKSDTYDIGEEDENTDGKEGDLVTYPPDPGADSLLAPSIYSMPNQRDSHFATLPNRSYSREDLSSDSEDEALGSRDSNRDSRYSKDYQFTIASPDEEMHGKAVALFDFARENENELPLTEGQVIWVSYRHGQGWLVAEDPKTGDAGLVPEEYVRLLSHIEGGLTYLSGGEQQEEESHPTSPVPVIPAESTITPTQADQGLQHAAQNSNGSNGEKRPPIVSTFSTSSHDLKPYPQHLLDEQARGAPPQVVHYGSQSNTPTITSPSSAPHTSLRKLTEAMGMEEEPKSSEEESTAETDEDSEADNNAKGKR
ncbi:HOG (high osmolarity glycerol) pathway protein [Lecanora helva]